MHLDRRHLPYIGFLAAFVCIFFWGLNYGDLIGHDYNYFFPKLLEGNWHFLRQGLSPFLYSPHYCGGFPEFANPQSMYYSVLQFLSLHLDLWIASQITIGAAMLIGYLGWYLFGRDVLKMNLHWSHVFALIISAHGFYFMHILAGHIIYHQMPLIGLLLWLLLERSRDTWKSLAWKASLFGLISANIIHSGGFYVAVMTVTAFLLLLPFELLIHRRVNVLRIASCTLAALLMNGGKLYASWSFMRFFPRNLPFERLSEGSSTLGYIWNALWGVPQRDTLFEPFGMPDWGALHEYSMALSPVVLIGLLCGMYLLWQNRNVIRKRPVQSLLFFIISTFLYFFITELIRGHGLLVTPLESLPIFSSLRINTRFLYPFSMLLSAVGVWSLMNITQGKKLTTVLCPLLSVLTVLFFAAAYVPVVLNVVPPRSLNYTDVQMHLAKNEGFLELDVNHIIDMRGEGQAEFVPLFAGANHVYCEEPLMWGDKPEMEELVVGDVYLGWNDHLNLYNPACFVYPESNDCTPGDRIKVSDMENFEQFVEGKKTQWKVPVMQSILNWVSLLTLLTSLTYLTYHTYRTTLSRAQDSS